MTLIRFPITALSVLTAALMAWPALGQAPQGTEFTYQGLLKDAGEPAGGTYDLQFKLFDAAEFGNPIGPVLCVEDVSVTDGLFTVTLDFGAQFAGDQRFLEVGVRPDSTPGNCSTGLYTPLDPRQELTAAPYAAFALSSPGSGLWSRSGSAIVNTNTGSFVGVNRSTTVSGAEYFGIQAPVSGANYGGMYIRTDSNQALPFYGYKAGMTGNAAWTYLDGNTSAWHVYNDGVRLTVEETGEVGIGTTTPDAPLHVAANETGDVIYATNTGSGNVAQLYVPGTASANALYAVTYGSGSAAFFEAHQPNSLAAVSIFKNGGPGLRVFGTFSAAGTPPTDAPAAVLGGSDSAPTGGGFIVCGGTNGKNISIDDDEIMARNAGAAATLALNTEGGNVGIGTSNPGFKLDVADRIRLRQGASGSAGLWLHQTTPGNDRAFVGMSDDVHVGLYGASGAGWGVVMDTTSGNVGIGTGSPDQRLVVSGTVKVDVLEIVGGADLAEPFEVGPGAEPGMVVVIDPDRPGQLKLASQPYDGKAAGIISGANGLSPGMVMKAKGQPHADGQHPVALSGRVWCRCDASFGAIVPGDLLTTSDRPGHAMRVGDDAALPRGCVIGKAMTGLDAGRGLVLVLVNLQ